ncbi:mitochondrial dicarboxylate carrier-like [Teleopsis dalmanni]|uniref:mitochondrial dicarboxylate carrier-like n=1 Tax=Teleopsis dalmanni TaxID=139649 RepID=UPI0018CF6549|nr:mitochondrial dicarboxylate carrier-like [Teleopsis dalmanni]
MTVAPERKHRWYFGGLSSAMAACFTHPLDLLKVHLQTNEKKLSLRSQTMQVFKESGIFGFYNGISASLMRQLTYSTARLGIYEVGKEYVNSDSFSSKILLAFMGGACAGFIGVPSDVVNVRMQNDMKLPKDQRRNYKNVFDGFIRIHREEGFKSLFAGSSLATLRSIIVTVASMPVYDHMKLLLKKHTTMREGLVLHCICSIVTAVSVTTMTQPIDVLKTRAMSAKPGEYKGVMNLIKQALATGPTTFFKGYVPSFSRIAPQTIIMFMFYEQLRINFGWIPPPPASKVDKV